MAWNLFHTNRSIAPGFNGTPRDYYHWFVNFEQFPEKLPEAEALAEYFLREAEEYMKEDKPGTELPNLYTFFEYQNHEHFKAKLYEHYHNLMEIRFNSWLRAGEPDMWFAPNKMRLIEFILQGVPFHFTDGAWLRGSVSSGVMDQVKHTLFTIWLDELGNGKFEHNHCNIYQDIITHAGIQLPELSSREFVDLNFLMDSAFTNSVFHLCVSLFGTTYFPEVLGMTLYLEWTSPPYHAAKCKIFERMGVSPLFSNLHYAVDNVSNGHGAAALKAIMVYLDNIESREGKQAAAAAWKRVWRGFVAYGITGGFEEDLQKKWQAEDSNKAFNIESQVNNILKKKAELKKTLSPQALDFQLGGKKLAVWLDNPSELTKYLERSDWVKPGNPRDSKLVNAINDSPLSEVFDMEDRVAFALWMHNMKPDPVADMVMMLEARSRAGSRAHGDIKLETPTGPKLLNDLFLDTRALMEALVSSGYVKVPPGGKLDDCKLLRSMGPGGPMATVMHDAERDIIRAWIQDGSKLPSPKAKL